MTTIFQPKAQYAFNAFDVEDDDFYATLEESYEIEGSEMMVDNAMDNIYMYTSFDDIIVPPRINNPVKAVMSAPTSMMSSFDSVASSVDVQMDLDDFDVDGWSIDDGVDGWQPEVDGWAVNGSEVDGWQPEVDGWAMNTYEVDGW